MYNRIDLPEQLKRLNLLDQSHNDENSTVPPKIPPKPKKFQNKPLNEGHIYVNSDSRQKVDNLYAVNAPAPGSVGMATARVNHGYAESKGHRNILQPASTNFKMYENPPEVRHHINVPSRRDLPVYHNSNIPAPSPTQSYSSYGVSEEFPLPPPCLEDTSSSLAVLPSSLSSSYCELETARKLPHNSYDHNVSQSNSYITYAPPSHTSSTYESIYEPVGSRPESQMSQVSSRRGYDPMRSNPYGPYASPKAMGLAPAPSAQPIMNPAKTGKEAEVDKLANLLVTSMDSTNDPDFFGICAQCGEKVIGEGTGCTAMEHIYHIHCFSCAVCYLKLQGKPFYALEKKPYCEDCYLNTLEKCSVCTTPILDRILRATGKPYHPKCFTCVVCGKSLDGIPFTVDASNQIHCIEDFHKKFAPRCSVCNDPIMPEVGQDETVRVVALDRSFHVNCYKCEDCGLLLSSEAEGRGCYPLDGHVLCKSCNAKRVQRIVA